MILKTNTCVKGFDGKTILICFLTEDDDLLKNFDSIWDKISASIKKEFDSESVYYP